MLAGGKVHLSVIGGSVSFGTTFTTSKSRALYHWKVYQYLNSSFPDARHEHYMGAVPASGPSYMEHCLSWHLPPSGADLVLVEYAVNFDQADEDAKSFERLIRRLLLLPNQPAIVIVNTMDIVPRGAGGLPWEHDRQLYPSARDLSFDYRGTGAEDYIVDIAAYYGVPCVSLRSAIFPELKRNSTAFPIKQLFHDRHHPGAWGHSLMAQMVSHLLESSLNDVLLKPQARHPPSHCAILGQDAKDAVEGHGGGSTLGASIFSHGDSAPIGACIKDKALQGDMEPGAVGFKYLVEGSDAKMKPGIVGRTPGDHARFCLDVSRLKPADSFVIIFGHLISYEHMGVGQVSCHNECECGVNDIDAHVPGGKFSVFKAKTIAATRRKTTGEFNPSRQACGCQVQVKILNRTGSGEHKFKILSLMAAQSEGSLRYGHQAGFNNRPTEARFQ